MNGWLSDKTVRMFLQTLAGTSCYASLHHDTPSAFDAAATEVLSPSYKRQKVTWKLLDRSLVNENGITWTNVDPLTVAGFGVFDAATAGSLLLCIPLPLKDRSASAGGNYTLPTGGLTVTFDA